MKKNKELVKDQLNNYLKKLKTFNEDKLKMNINDEHI